MSSDVMSVGLMAPVMNPPKDVDELTEQMWQDNSPLELSYDGTLAWISTRGDSGYGLNFGVETEVGPEELGLAGLIYGLNIAVDQARPFMCLWYNGSDSDMHLLTVEQFLIRTNQ